MPRDFSPEALRRTPIALTLIAINVAVYVALVGAPGLEDVLGLPAGWDAIAGRPWTPLTVIFTAGSLLHLAGAVAFILIVGRELEQLAGAAHLLAVYVLAGLVGSLALTAVAGSTASDGPSLGASASFLGLFGAIAVLPQSERLARFPILPILAAVILVNVAGPLVGIGGWESSAAHGAGIAVGGLYGLVLRSRERTTVVSAH